MFSKLFLAWIVLVMAGGCASAPSPHVLWDDPQILRRAPLQDGAATAANDLGKPWVLAWPGDALAPELHLLTQGQDALTLNLGITPRRVSVYPGGQTQLLWLDVNNLGEVRLTAALVDAQGTVLRGPTGVSTHPTRDYQARPLPDGGVITLWNESGNSTTLYLQPIDANGRPYPPLKLSNAGEKPALAFDRHGSLHLAWLERLSPTLATLQYLSLSPDQLLAIGSLDAAAVKPLPVGAINGMADELAIGADSDRVVCLWTQRIGPSDAAVEGLMFPIGDPTSSHSLTVDLPGIGNPRGLAVPDQASDSIALAIIGRDVETHTDIPLLVTLTDGKTLALQRVAEGLTGSLERVSLARGWQGDLHIAWTEVEDDGTTTIYSATQPH